MNANSSMMTPWLHFRGGDNLLFKSLQPSSKGAIAAACIVLIVTAVFERWVAATRYSVEVHWRQRALAMVSKHSANSTPRIDGNREKLSEEDIQVTSRTSSSLQTRSRNAARTIAPFIAFHDIPRGAIHAFQALLAYTLMLAVMTFQAAYLISIIIGLGLGEVLFGRIGNVKHVH